MELLNGTIWDETDFDYLHPVFSGWMTLLLPVIALISSSYVVYKCSRGRHRGIEGGRILLVTAHPDDECMFFGPVIVHLSKSADFYVLCLSPGNFYGLGRQRKTELWNSCRVLGVNPNNVTLVKHDELQDNPKTEWAPELVASLIARSVETLSIDAVISFDKFGVSGHQNHIAIYKALKLLSYRQDAEALRLYSLKSISLFTKYLGFFPFILYAHLPLIYTSSVEDRQRILTAMEQHVSQYVWFRKLFMTFSAHTHFNVFSIVRR